MSVEADLLGQQLGRGSVVEAARGDEELVGLGEQQLLPDLPGHDLTQRHLVAIALGLDDEEQRVVDTPRTLARQAAARDDDRLRSTRFKRCIS